MSAIDQYPALASSSAPFAIDGARAALERSLAERLAARVSCSLDEIAAFPSASGALDAVATQLFAGRRVVVARPAGDAIATRATSAAASVREIAAQPLDGLIAAARDAEVLVISSPVFDPRINDGRATATISPRELLLLRSRAPRPVIVLDLLDEEFARTPLTQPALLLPGTVIVRGFGELWRNAGATSAAELAFVAGPRDLVELCVNAPCAAPLDPATISRACADLDRPGIDRAVQAAALAVRMAG